MLKPRVKKDLEKFIEKQSILCSTLRPQSYLALSTKCINVLSARQLCSFARNAIIIFFQFRFVGGQGPPIV